ncbi:uncharacterized protein LOC143360537 [Halictus rubicundus]|uniref:uncharacterized protein LOC143360537 n=1 Tax=Halictus rubicundus TaxID=77578 RepID=UPI0040363396
MENPGAVTIKGKDYEIVDECIEVDDASNNALDKTTEDSANVEEQSGNVEEQSGNVEEQSENVEEQSGNVEEQSGNVEEQSGNVEEQSGNVEEQNTAEQTTGEQNVGGHKADEQKTDVTIESDIGTNDEQKDNLEEDISKVDNLKEDNLREDMDIPLVDLTDDVQPDSVNINNNVENNASNADDKYTQSSNTESIDFTADISLDQLHEQQHVAIEDYLHKLDKIQNMVLNSSGLQGQEENNKVEKENVTSDLEKEKAKRGIETDKNINSANDGEDMKMEVEPENSAENEWYDKKLAVKEAIVKERLTKMARIFGISYPCYERWLQWELEVNGSPLCKLRPARRCCLKKPYTNRWKFVCNRKKVQDTKETGNDDTSNTKNMETVWKLEPSGAWGVNINNELEFPPFVFRAVKVFEEFLQTTENPTDANGIAENASDVTEVEARKESNIEAKQEWCWLVVRCNSMDKLMLFATGKNISHSTMDRLKQTFESGSGKDCNVKSLYCKSINKVNDTTVTDTTFLVGSEALDEIVGGLKVQLAPKTNFWSNTAGAENVAKAVMDLLALNPKTTLIEIGCGIGLIGLMMASKCQNVVGVDLPSEVEEAEMTCELNNIKNASFIMGSPSEVTSKIVQKAKGRKTCAIVNANTNIGRAIEVMACLRKIVSIKRIVMITTLTKQSVRAILELARPMETTQFGCAFIPIVACVVDTLPVGPHFEVVILLQRRPVEKLGFPKLTPEMVKSAGSGKAGQEKTTEQKTNGTDKKTAAKEAEARKSLNKLLTKFPAKKAKPLIKKLGARSRNLETAPFQSKFKGKRPHSPDAGGVPPKKVMKKFGKLNPKPWQADMTAKKKKEWNTESQHLKINPLYEKKLREHTAQADLRERLSNNRGDMDIAQRVKQHHELLKIAKEKLSGPAPTVDVNTAKQLQSMLNMVLEQTNKLQSQLPRSVWDRIAPAENTTGQRDVTTEDDSLLAGRYVQEMDAQEILMATAKQFSDNQIAEQKTIYKKYNNVPPLEPNTVLPVGPATNYRTQNPFRVSPDRYQDTHMREQPVQGHWSRDKPFERNRWNEMGNMRKPNSPIRRQASPMKHRQSPPKRFSPKRPLLSPPRRLCSPPRRHFSPMHRESPPVYRQRSPVRRPQSPPLRRPMSPHRRPLSPRRASPPRRPEMTMNRPMSPIRPDASILRREISPLRIIVSPSRRQISPMRRQTSTPRRQVPSPNRMMSPNTQEMMLSRRQVLICEKQQMSPMRRAESPQRFMFGRPASPPRRQPSPPRRQMSPPQRFADEWDIPSRGAVEQNIWSRPTEKPQVLNVYRMDKPSTSTNNWDQNSSNDRQRKNLNLEKWDAKDSNRDNAWNIGGSSWNPKQTCPKPMAKETWTSGSDNRWSNAPNMPGTSNDNWNIRGKESFNPRKESWLDNNKKQSRWETFNMKDNWKQNDKEDLNDLPEDARDPWGDDGNNLGLKERWLKLENTAPSSSSMWMRENDKPADTWLKHQDNWQNIDTGFAAKPPQWQNNGIKNMRESRWTSQNDNEKKPSSTWQSGKNVGSWQPQNSNFQHQRSFSTNQFKGFH